MAERMVSWECLNAAVAWVADTRYLTEHKGWRRGQPPESLVWGRGGCFEDQLGQGIMTASVVKMLCLGD